MKRLLLALSLVSAFVWMLADVSHRNGIAITTASTINGKTPNSHINGLVIVGGSNLPAPILWLVGDDITQSDGDSVTNWPDSSGFGRTATVDYGPGFPVFKTGVLNGHDIVRFDGVSNSMATAVFDVGASTTNTTVLSVFVRRSINGTTEGDWILENPGTLSYLASYNNFSTTNYSSALFGITSGSLIAPATNTPYAVLVRSDGVGHINFTAIGPVTPDYSAATLTNMSFRIGGYPGTTLPTETDYAEILVWSPSLTDDQVAWAMAYATNKYNP